MIKCEKGTVTINEEHPTVKTDTITLEDALEFPFWKIVWAGEPQRKISVEMTYDDLVRIVDLMNEETEGGKEND